MKIAYCIPGLYNSGGMERVLTLKANYFADVLGYDVIVILTEGKGKDYYYKLSSRIKVINLDINFDSTYGLPIYIRAFKQIAKERLFTFCRELKRLFSTKEIRLSSSKT